MQEKSNDHGLETMSEFFDVRADIYDSHMLDDLNLGEFYEAIAGCFEKPVKRLLDLGCGTGLEFERLFERYPDMSVTGIDLSQKMLDKLAEKYPDKNISMICGSYFEVDFGEPYDHVLSTYSLHHFDEENKLSLYKKIHSALKPGGLFIFGDYTVPTEERQNELSAANIEKRRSQGIKDGEFYHYDTPFTPETEMRLMTEAGFIFVKIVRQWENTAIIAAER